MENDTLLIIDSSEENADLLYATGFFVPDPVIFIQHKGKKMLVLSDLELDRGKAEADVDVVLSLTEYRKKLSASKLKNGAGFADITALVFKENDIKGATVPAKFALKYADELRKSGFKITPKKEEPFFAQRLRKNAKEVEFIKDALRKTAKAMELAMSMVASSEIKGGKLYLNGSPLTSERIKGEVNAELSRVGFVASHTIVAGGVQASMPHNRGEGQLYANQPIVIDIFPRSQHNGYFGDMTRTVIRGEPSKELDKMYKTVLEGQKLGISLIKHGVKSKEVHGAIVDYFKKSGFETGMLDGKMQGFIHSTGHGLGLEIHEPPRVSVGEEVLEEGNVVTVEPGLYYEKIGGIRIEDVVLVEKDGCTNLTRCVKKFRV